MEFIWDPQMAADNLAKHGISFLAASHVFDDPFHLEEDTTRPEFGEIRGRAIGLAGAVIVTVIYTDRPAARRIISPRRASRDERRRYHRSTTAR